MATSAKKKTNQNTSYTTTSGQKVSIKNGVKTYSGAATPAPKIGSVVNGTKVGYNVGGKSYADSSDAERGNAIDVATIPAKMTPETPANIPTYTIPNFGDITGQNNIGLGAVTSQFGTTYDAKTGQFVTAPTGTQDNFQSLFEQATALGNTAFEEMGTAESRLKKLEKENQLKQKQQAVNETTGQINAIVAQAQAQQLALEGQGRGQTSSFIGGEQARINREAAIQAIPLQAKLAAEQGALELAQEHIDKMFTVQSQDALAKYQYRSKLIESVYNFATGAEQRRLDAIKQKEDRAYDMQKFNIQYQRDLASQAAEYGLGGVASSILKANPLSPTFEADIARYASQVVKPVVATKLDTQVVDGQLINMQTGEVIKNISGTSSYTGEFANVVDNASNLVGAERGKTSKVAISKALSDGDFVSAYALIGNNVEESLTGETKSKFANARTDIAVMSGMRDAVQAYADAGGDMGFLKGTANDIARSLGQLTSDPQFASLAVYLQREFQAYRNNLTGAAFSPGESREYASVNPRTNASLDLNLATIDGALSQLENRVTSTINTRVPGASALYERVSGKQTGDVIDPRQAPTGTVVEIGGTKYKKVGDNEYLPI